MATQLTMGVGHARYSSIKQKKFCSTYKNFHSPKAHPNAGIDYDIQIVE